MADSTISGLTAATALQAADLAAVVQGGTTKKATLAQIQANSLPLAGGTMTGALVAPPSSFTNSASSNVCATFGSDFSLTTRTDVTNKYAIFGAAHYTNAEQPVGMLYTLSTSSSNTLKLGGGTSLVNAVTSGHLYAGAGSTTASGTSMLYWSNAGVRIQSGATAAASSLFHVAATGDANALRVDDTTGNVGMGIAPGGGGNRLTVAGTGVYQVRVAYDASNHFQVNCNSIGVVTMFPTGSAPQIRLLAGAGSEFVRLSGAGFRLEDGVTGDAAATAILDVTSTTQGFLPPRMTTTQRDAIGSPATGLEVYNTTTNKKNFYNGSAWEAVTSA